MPEVHLHLAWPDGHTEWVTSPSRAIEAHVCAGATYPVDELLRRTDEGLHAADERVRERFGMACSAAAATREHLHAAAAEHGAAGDGRVRVLATRRGASSSVAGTPRALRLSGHVPVVVVGGGQAGLAMSWCLRGRDVEHVVLERHTIAHSWREQRWESFSLVTPNWQCRLPGHPYAGDDPDGFMLRDEVVAYVEDYARRFDPPVHEGVTVTRVAPRQDDPLAADGAGFTVSTSVGDLTADAVVLAVGGYHRPRIPALARDLPEHVAQVHSSAYRSGGPLPDGAVLVVGSGQSGAQIAEDLHLEGRDVHLAVGTAPRVARAYRGRDVVAWLHDMGRYDLAIEDHPEGPGARTEANHYVTGRGGGRDIDLRAFAAEGMRLHGRLVGVDVGQSTLACAGDLRANLDAADATSERIKDAVDAWIAKQGVEAPTEDRYVAVWEPGPDADAGTTLDLEAAGVSAVVWATGFRSDWSFVDLPAFDSAGYPAHRRGVTSVEGLFVLGLPWLHTWGSGRFAGIARDARHLAASVAEGLAGEPAAALAAPSTS